MTFAIKKDSRLFAILQMPDGKLVKKEVKKDAGTVRKYDAYVKSLKGIYVPKSMSKYLYQPDQVKP